MSSMINKVYFDMDGVLVNFDLSLQNFSGQTTEDILKSRDDFKNGKLEKDPILVLMHKHVKEGLFEKAPEMEEFAIFIEMMEWLRENKIDFEILSSVTGESFGDIAIEQKKNWLQKRKIDCIQNYTKGAAEKIAYTGSENVLLIDDYKKNVNTFLENNSQAIHHHDIKKTLEKFKQFFPSFELRKNKNLLKALSQKSVLDKDIEVQPEINVAKKRKIAF